MILLKKINLKFNFKLHQTSVYFNVVPASIFLSSDLKIKSTSSNRILEIVKYLDEISILWRFINYLDHDKFEKNDINVFI